MMGRLKEKIAMPSHLLTTRLPSLLIISVQGSVDPGDKKVIDKTDSYGYIGHLQPPGR